MGIIFFRTKGFIFQDWLEYQGLASFVEMSRDWYPDLVRLFYANLKVINGTLCFRVKGVDIRLDEDVWTSIAGICLGGYKSHLGMPRVNKLTIYKACFINAEVSLCRICIK